MMFLLYLLMNHNYIHSQLKDKPTILDKGLVYIMLFILAKGSS